MSTLSRNPIFLEKDTSEVSSLLLYTLLAYYYLQMTPPVLILGLLLISKGPSCLGTLNTYDEPQSSFTNVRALSLRGVRNFINRASREQQPEDVVDGGSCAICMEEFRVGGSKVSGLANCRHVFHTKCLQQWVECK